ncbi:hypothetical protein Lal_00036767 [Lupinus albus]|nr:hypothetical protein Lal_00036767 [Lupinus albus]
MRHANLFEEEPLLDELLRLSGFSKLSSLRCFNIDSSLITALVERWRSETHTFHLPCGECTITLEDVSLQIGMNVNGLPVTGPTYFDWDEMCGELLGKILINEEDMRGCELKLGQTQLIFQGVQREDLTEYRSCLDHMEANDFKWLPYETYNNNLPREVQQDKKVWSACTTLICFSIVEWHQTDRVRLQFGLVQDLPQPPKNLDALHRIDKWGNQDANWATKHAQWIEYWSNHRDQVLQGPQIQYPIHTQQYMIWCRRNSKLFLSSETQLRDSRQINFQTNQIKLPHLKHQCTNL